MLKSLAIPLIWKEIIITSIAFSTYFFAGTCEAYVAFFIVQLNTSNIVTTVTDNEVSWLGSLALFVMPIGCFLGGFVMDFFGRKFFFTASFVPHFISWLIMGFANNIWLLYLGRIIGGIGSGMSFCTPTYISEICSTRNRGAMLGLGELAFQLGISFCNILVWSTDWKISAFVLAVLSALNGMAVLVLPESPNWLAGRGRFEEALGILSSVRTDQEAQSEISDLQAHYNRVEKRTIVENTKDLFMCWKQMGILLGMYTLGCGAGSMFMICYSVMFFEYLNLPGNPSVAAIGHSTVCLIGSCLPFVFSMYFGRKKCLAISGLGMTVFISAVTVYESVYIEAENKPYYELVLACFYAFDITYCIGVMFLPFTMASELLPPQVAGIGAGTYGFLNAIIGAIALKAFPYCLIYLGTISVLATMTVCSLSIVPFAIFLLPETKDKTILQVQEKYFSK